MAMIAHKSGEKYPRTMSVSCIIPFYNEKGRIQNIVTDLLCSRQISRIVCVDDGSTDNGHLGLADLSPLVQVIRLPDNLGKAEAVKAGLPHVTTPTILLMDADLYDLDLLELDQAIRAFEKNPAHSMLIFQMKRFLPASRFFRGDILFSGIRLIRQPVLEGMYRQRHVNGYQLELALNHYCLQNYLSVVTFPFYAKSVFSIHKLGLWQTLYRDFYTYPDAIAHVGLKSFISQLLWFAREEIKVPPSFNLLTLINRLKQTLWRPFK
jgi:glycosyltransferase involved in cell wall biosynthesis